jgi:hypothetical protein
MNLASHALILGRGVHTGVAWGTVPDWVAAIGSSVAFVIAAIALLIEVTTRRQSQARRVYCVRVAAGKYEAGAHIYGIGAERGVITKQHLPEMVTVNDPYGLPYEANGPAALMFHLRIVNESGEIIGPALVKAIGPGVSLPIHALAAYIVRPSESVATYPLCPWTLAPEPPLVDIEISFRDSSGRWWTRKENLPIRAVRRRQARVLEQLARTLVDALD